MKRKCVIVTMFCLIAILFINGCGNHHLKDPALEISNAVYTEFPELDEEYSKGIVIIDGVKFLDWDFFGPHVYDDRDTFDYAGEVVSYFINDDHYVFYCEVKGLDPEEWLIRVPDNGKSKLMRDEAYFIHEVNVTDIPEWLTEVRS